jgi:ankyrin repeat protein
MRKMKLMLYICLFLIIIIANTESLQARKETFKPLKYSTIHEAVAAGDLEDVINHLQRGEAVNAIVGGATPLHVAAIFNRVKIAEFLIKNGANINAKTIEYHGYYPREGYTALEIAAEKGYIEMVKLLLRKGASVSAYAIARMLDKGYTELAFEMTKKADYSILYDIVHWPRSRSSKKNALEIVEVLIKKADTKVITEALKEAVISGKAEIAELLLKHGADINAMDIEGESLLHLGLESFNRICHIHYELIKDIDILRVLIKYGANVNAKDKDGFTPFHRTIQLDPNCFIDMKLFEDVFNLLIENGADVNAKTNSGNTPLHLIAEKGVPEETYYISTIQILINHGADPNIRNNDGKTPLDIAIEKGNITVVDELRKYGRHTLKK